MARIGEGFVTEIVRGGWGCSHSAVELIYKVIIKCCVNGAGEIARCLVNRTSFSVSCTHTVTAQSESISSKPKAYVTQTASLTYSFNRSCEPQVDVHLNHVPFLACGDD